MAHSILKQIGARPGEDDDADFLQLTEFQDRNISPDQIANEIGDYFSAISQEF